MFANAGPNTRTTQLFINYVDNKPLDTQGFTPFGKVVDGMPLFHTHKNYFISFISSLIDSSMLTAQSINAQYAEQPDQNLIYSEGNVYLKSTFPALDYITSVQIVNAEL